MFLLGIPEDPPTCLREYDGVSPSAACIQGSLASAATTNPRSVTKASLGFLGPWQCLFQKTGERYNNGEGPICEASQILFSIDVADSVVMVGTVTCFDDGGCIVGVATDSDGGVCGGGVGDIDVR